MRIAIVTDTSCNFTPAEAEDLGIYILPMQIIFDEHSYKDAFEITVEQFYKQMEKSTIMPTTSQPAIGVFLEVYKKLVKEYDKVISIHPSGKLSGTVRTAQMAATQVNENKIKVFDSKMVSILSGYLVREAKRLVDKGKSYEMIIKRLEDMQDKTFAYIVLENFEYLARSGRIPKIASRLTTLAQIKPILKISSKGLELEKLVRTSKRAMRQLEKTVYNYIDNVSYSLKVDVAHGDYMHVAEEVHERLVNKYPEIKSQIHRLAGVIGVHTGPEIVGFTITPEYSKDD